MTTVVENGTEVVARDERAGAPSGDTRAGSATGATRVVFEPWTFRTVMKDYKKVPIMAVLAGVIAFMGSMIVPPTYASGTRVLIRGRETTLLDSTGASLSGQPGVLDSQLAASLAETQGALLVTRRVATEIVDRLDLDDPVDNSGFVGTVRVVLAETYLRSRAIVTHGFYKKPERRERMIGMVQGGIGAKQVENGFVLEIAALWEEPEIAADIANEAADILVEQSSQRFVSESAAYRDFLEAQLRSARTAEQRMRTAVADFQRENGISDIGEELLLSARSILEIDDDVDANEADLDAASATADTLEKQLAEMTPMIDTNQEIVTGRSETVITNTELDPTFAALNTQLQQARAAIAGLQARRIALVAARNRVLTAGTAELTDEENELRRLLFDERIASQQVVLLTTDFNEAQLNAERPQLELMRLDTAAPPIYPVGPKRYLYLGIGLFVGGLVGFMWSFLKVKRREQRLLWEAEHGGPDDLDLDLATSDRR